MVIARSAVKAAKMLRARQATAKVVRKNKHTIRQLNQGRSGIPGITNRPGYNTITDSGSRRIAKGNSRLKGTKKTTNTYRKGTKRTYEDDVDEFGLMKFWKNY